MEQRYGIFISYRREDGAEFAEGLGMALSNKGYRVFFDKHNLRVGGNFPKELSSAVCNCYEFISIVTPSYCGINRNGNKRILEPGDWVHEEIKTALGSENTQIFPISIDCVPPQGQSLPSDISEFADKNFILYNRAYDTYEKIVERIEPDFCEATRENATIGKISDLLATVDVNDSRQFNVVCKDISRFLNESTGEKALLHILNAKTGNHYIYGRDYRYVVFYTLFSGLRRNHQAIKLIDLVKQHGQDFLEYSFTQYVFVEYYHILYQLDTDISESREHLQNALSFARKAIEMLPQNNGILHCFALTIVMVIENNIPVNTDDKDYAFRIIKQIIANDPNYALYYCTYARLLASEGMYQDALLNLKRAQALEKPTHKDWILRISDYRKYELIVRLKESVQRKN